MVRELRKGNSKTGLILANGGVLTYQHVLCLSTQPRRGGSEYPLSNPLPRYITDLPAPSITAHAEGEAVIEVLLSPSPLSPLSPPFPPFPPTTTPPTPPKTSPNPLTSPPPYRPTPSNLPATAHLPSASS